MRILYYTWFENSQEDMEETLISLGYEVVKCNIPFKDYEEDEAFLSQFFGVLQQYQCDCIFSFNFFPMIAKTAEKYRIKYISWVYDCPHWTLYSPAVKSAYNYIFVFDRAQYLTLSSFGLLHVHHLALSVNAGRLCRLILPQRQGMRSALSGVFMRITSMTKFSICRMISKDIWKGPWKRNNEFMGTIL